jgi:methylenetetrahydrofolate--tRNA-(uracil-5-)-methyltransferase
MKVIKVIGGGLAGTECAWQLAQGIEKYNLPYKVKLYEMRPRVKTPAHHTNNLAELVCSNSLGSELLTTARGVLIHEMMKFESLIIAAAKHAQVPAGQALAVDRDNFAKYITEAIEKHPRIELIREEFKEDLRDYLENGEYVVIASGPLTSDHLAKNITSLLNKIQPPGHLATQSPFLHFFDAAAPIVDADSINMDIAFKASRYGKESSMQDLERTDDGDYINCPFYSQEDFDKFYNALMTAERAPLKEFEKETAKFFQGCMPIERIAEQGQKTLCFGPLKPVGLRDPRDPERKPVAVVQLRQDNVAGSLYNIVGFQTNLKWGEQKRVFSMIPGLQNLEIVRYGVMHQNIFINSPLFLNADMSLKASTNIFFAGQITGVEGYTESAGTGIVAARSIISKLNGDSAELFPQETMLGALAHYISHSDPKHFQPINSNWGLINTDPDNLDKKYRKDKRLRQEFLADRALKRIALLSS